jgi:hypothetical protein
MKGMIRITKGTGKVIRALLTGILMPLLIWVALVVALIHKLREMKQMKVQPMTESEILERAGLTIQEQVATEKSPAMKTIIQQPECEIFELLAKAGINAHVETETTHCWKVLNCPLERYGACPSNVRRDIPLWAVKGLDKSG